jgi:hypothetical protein
MFAAVCTSRAVRLNLQIPWQERRRASCHERVRTSKSQTNSNGVPTWKSSGVDIFEHWSSNSIFCLKTIDKGQHTSLRSLNAHGGEGSQSYGW